MYLTTTWPDILNDVSILSRFMHYASEWHLKAAKRVIRYVKGTCDLALNSRGARSSSWLDFQTVIGGGSVDDMKSTFGLLFHIWFQRLLMQL